MNPLSTLTKDGVDYEVYTERPKRAKVKGFLIYHPVARAFWDGDGWRSYPGNGTLYDTAAKAQAVKDKPKPNRIPGGAIICAVVKVKKGAPNG